MIYCEPIPCQSWGYAWDIKRLVLLSEERCAVPPGCRSSADGQIINTPRITHGHVIPVAPVEPAVGLFASPEWQDGGADKQFDVVVYNSLTVDPISESRSYCLADIRSSRRAGGDGLVSQRFGDRADYSRVAA